MTLSTLLVSIVAAIAYVNAPTGMMCDMIEHNGVEYAKGYGATVCSSRPAFSWELPASDKRGVKQVAYRILVSTVPSILYSNHTDVWDSGKVMSDQSVAVPFGGNTPLEPKTTYYWRVKVWTQSGPSEWSEFRFFRTAAKLDGDYSHYPLELTSQRPVSTKKIARNRYLCDFGKDAFAQPLLLLKSKKDAKLTVRLGEKLDSIGFIDQYPGGTIRFGQYYVKVSRGRSYLAVNIPHDARNAKNADKPNPAGDPPILMPDYIGEVFPFRYMDIEGIKPENIERQVVNYPFNDNASSFSCSDKVLKDVWDFCKYSIKATSFTGIYVDGDRERIPYEADALINQLCHYSVDKEFTMARRTADFLLDHSTWPTEWQLQMPLMAWNDLLYTGDMRFCEEHYDLLAAKCLTDLRNADGLISTVGTVTPELCAKLNYKGPDPIHDIVDWPRVGAFGPFGEDDSYDMVAVNTVVNAWHYRSLTAMSHIASALGKDDDAARFAALAEQTARSINSLLYDAEAGAYRDGIGSEHHALHASLFPLAFGIVPEELVGQVAGFVKGKGMACSVYAAQFLLEGLFDAGEDEYAISLMTSKSDRSWYNMMREGSTITMEAWGQKYKPNQDWNHAWGAAPANIVARKMLGIEPIEPGFGAVRIKPQVGKVKSGTGIVPTIRGQIKIEWSTTLGRKHFTISIPAGMDAEIWLPGKTEPVRTGSGTYSF